MIIGVPKEIKNHEYRVGLTPSGARELIACGHHVLIQHNAGAGIGLSNEDYLLCGAEIIDTAATLFQRAEMIIKVKEPQPNECKMLHSGQILFTYLHLAADPHQTALLLESGVTAIAYETVTDNDNNLPLLAPMSEVAGRMAIQAGAHCLEKSQGGNGILLGGVAGVEPANVLIIGGGVVGVNAARMALGLGAHVTIMDKSLIRLKLIDERYGSTIHTLFSTQDTVEKELKKADLVIGAVLIAGATAPKIINKTMLKLMKEGTVLVDVAIDQGGCFETSRATTHTAPTYKIEGIIHYCVANIPGAVARTSTFALTNATLPYIISLANKGCTALLENKHFQQGLNIHNGLVTHKAVATALGYKYHLAEDAIGKQK